MSPFLRAIGHRVVVSLMYGETAAVRLWLAAVELLLSLYLLKAANITPYFTSMLASAPTEYPALAWALVFFTHSIVLVLGLSGRYNLWTLLIEGVMGWCAWGIVAITNAVDQGFPGPFMACWLAMTWILIRYPTHWIEWGRRDD